MQKDLNGKVQLEQLFGFTVRKMMLCSYIKKLLRTKHENAWLVSQQKHGKICMFFHPFTNAKTLLSFYWIQVSRMHVKSVKV